MCLCITVIIIAGAPWSTSCPRTRVRTPASPGRGEGMLRGWRNTVEIVLFEISESMKLYPFVTHISVH